MVGVKKVGSAEQGKMVQGMRWCGVACVDDADYGHGACDEDEEAGAHNIDEQAGVHSYDADYGQCVYDEDEEACAHNIDAVWCSFPLVGC